MLKEHYNKIFAFIDCMIIGLFSIVNMNDCKQKTQFKPEIKRKDICLNEMGCILAVRLLLVASLHLATIFF